MLSEQRQLQKMYEELTAAQHVLRTLPNKHKLRENQVPLVLDCMSPAMRTPGINKLDGPGPAG
jgi:hypothetical protein